MPLYCVWFRGPCNLALPPDKISKISSEPRYSFRCPPKIIINCGQALLDGRDSDLNPSDWLKLQQFIWRNDALYEILLTFYFSQKSKVICKNTISYAQLCKHSFIPSLKRVCWSIPRLSSLSVLIVVSKGRGAPGVGLPSGVKFLTSKPKTSAMAKTIPYLVRGSLKKNLFSNTFSNKIKIAIYLATPLENSTSWIIILKYNLFFSHWSKKFLLIFITFSNDALLKEQAIEEISLTQDGLRIS